MSAALAGVAIGHAALECGGCRLLLAEADAGRLFETEAALEALLRRALTARERERAGAIESPHRLREWLAGRLAAKALVARQAGALEPAAIEIWADEHGAPRVRFTDSARGAFEPPEISISHSHGRVLAAAIPAAAGARVGVDIEAVAPRRDAFVRRILTARELDALAAFEGRVEERVAVLWSLKEAAGKALGVGMPRFLPWQIELTPGAADGSWSVTLTGSALDRFTELGALEARGHGAVAAGFARATAVVTLRRGVAP